MALKTSLLTFAVGFRRPYVYITTKTVATRTPPFERILAKGDCPAYGPRSTAQMARARATGLTKISAFTLHAGSGHPQTARPCGGAPSSETTLGSNGAACCSLTSTQSLRRRRTYVSHVATKGSAESSNLSTSAKLARFTLRRLDDASNQSAHHAGSGVRRSIRLPPTPPPNARTGQPGNQRARPDCSPLA